MKPLHVHGTNGHDTSDIGDDLHVDPGGSHSTFAFKTGGPKQSLWGGKRTRPRGWLYSTHHLDYISPIVCFEMPDYHTKRLDFSKTSGEGLLLNTITDKTCGQTAPWQFERCLFEIEILVKVGHLYYGSIIWYRMNRCLNVNMADHLGLCLGYESTIGSRWRKRETNKASAQPQLLHKEGGQELTHDWNSLPVEDEMLPLIIYLQTDFLSFISIDHSSSSTITENRDLPLGVIKNKQIKLYQ